MSKSLKTRPPAVAGTFYPADPGILQRQINDYLNTAEIASPRVPKAVIVPHAGFIYSGIVAASAYKIIQTRNNIIKKVILLGPAHRVAIDGLAAPSADQFQTPLGDIAIDHESLAELASNIPYVKYSDFAHSEEHSLEVQLPFLQEVLLEFELIPLVVGDATELEVAKVIEHLWGGDETLIVISSDLSHFHNYEKAVRVDRQTAELIETFRGMDLAERSACGKIPICGLLRIARHSNLSIERFDLRNSGDTAGDRQRVVGYGAWGIFG